MRVQSAQKPTFYYRILYRISDFGDISMNRLENLLENNFYQPIFFTDTKIKAHINEVSYSFRHSLCKFLGYDHEATSTPLREMAAE